MSTGMALSGGGGGMVPIHAVAAVNGGGSAPRKLRVYALKPTDTCLKQLVATATAPHHGSNKCAIAAKLQIAANEDVYDNTRNKALQDIAEARKKQTKELNSKTTRNAVNTKINKSRQGTPSEDIMQQQQHSQQNARSNHVPLHGGPNVGSEKRRSLRSRVMHWLVLKPYSKVELRLRLSQDGRRLSDSDQQQLDSVLHEVGVLKSGTSDKFTFNKAFLSDLDPEWPYGSSFDKSLLKRILATSQGQPQPPPTTQRPQGSPPPPPPRQSNPHGDSDRYDARQKQHAKSKPLTNDNQTRNVAASDLGGCADGSRVTSASRKRPGGPTTSSSTTIAKTSAHDTSSKNMVRQPPAAPAPAKLPALGSPTASRPQHQRLGSGGEDPLMTLANELKPTAVGIKGSGPPPVKAGVTKDDLALSDEDGQISDDDDDVDENTKSKSMEVNETSALQPPPKQLSRSSISPSAQPPVNKVKDSASMISSLHKYGDHHPMEHRRHNGASTDNKPPQNYQKKPRDLEKQEQSKSRSSQDRQKLDPSNKRRHQLSKPPEHHEPMEQHHGNSESPPKNRHQQQQQHQQNRDIENSKNQLQQHGPTEQLQRERNHRQPDHQQQRRDSSQQQQQQQHRSSHVASKIKDGASEKHQPPVLNQWQDQHHKDSKRATTNDKDELLHKHRDATHLNKSEIASHRKDTSHKQTIDAMDPAGRCDSGQTQPLSTNGHHSPEDKSKINSKPGSKHGDRNLDSDAGRSRHRDSTSQQRSSDDPMLPSKAQASTDNRGAMGGDLVNNNCDTGNASKNACNEENIVVSADSSNRTAGPVVHEATRVFMFGTDFPPIDTYADCVRYRELFNTEYEVYKAVFDEVAVVARKFQRLEEKLNNTPKDSPDYAVVEAEITEQYQAVQADRHIQEARRKHEYLRAKLAHIKQAVKNYEAKHKPPSSTINSNNSGAPGNDCGGETASVGGEYGTAAEVK